MHTISKLALSLMVAALFVLAVGMSGGARAAADDLGLGDATSTVSDGISTSTPDIDVSDSSATTTDATSTDMTLSDATTTPDVATTTEDSATTTESDATTTPDAPPSAPVLDHTPPQLSLPKNNTIPQMGTLSLIAGGTPVRMRFADQVTSSDSWSGVFERPRSVATSTVAGSVSAIAFGPSTPIVLDQYVRIEFASQAASSTAVRLSGDKTIVPISQQCVAGGAQAPRDLFLTYSGPDCVSHWGNDLVIITKNTGVFAAVRSDN